MSGWPLNSSSLSTSSHRPVIQFLRRTGNADSTRYEFRLRNVAVEWFRPQIRLDDHAAPCMGLEYSSDAVVRTWSPGSRASGCASLPAEICAAQFSAGKNHNRVDHESIRPC